jgi:4'-phosphopantetheinyl transferase
LGEWITVDSIQQLGSAETVVWKFSPGELAQYSRLMRSFLSGDEKKRLDRFINEASRQEFIFCRGILRFILAELLGKSPRSLNIGASEHGKPVLIVENQANFISFNISHTEDLCLIAFSRDCEVGIDVEKVHFIRKSSSLSQTYLSPEEFSEWRKVPEQQKSARFIDFWCAKEAILKAAGCGLTIHPNQVNTIEALSEQVVRGVQEDGCFFEFRDCHLTRLPLPEDYCGWLAVFGTSKSIRLCRFKQQLLEKGYSSDGRNVEK